MKFLVGELSLDYSTDPTTPCDVHNVCLVWIHTTIQESVHKLHRDDDSNQLHHSARP